MRAAIYREFGAPLQVEEHPEPSPPPHGVVIEVRATGMCRSDWHGWCGHDPDIRVPHVPGHEWAGVVREVGAGVERFRAGDRVTAPFIHGCGRCPTCARGDAQVCPRQEQPGFTHWGTYASLVALHAADFNLQHLPEDMDFDTAASLGCRFATAYRAVRQQGRLQEGEWVAVYGCGGVGLSAVQIAAAMGAQVIAIDLDPARLQLATELGAAHGLRADQVDDPAAAVVDISEGGVQLSLDALGSLPTCRQSILSLGRRGRQVQVGLMTEDGGEAALPMARIIAWELEILGSHGMAGLRYPEMFAFLREAKIDPGALVTRRVDLDHAARLLPEMHREQDRGVTVIDRFGH